ncbi:MAG: transporter transrane protein [Firmicutes bacterium]|nr:transporter transrane protein [Bacillota bacterium]
MSNDSVQYPGVRWLVLAAGILMMVFSMMTALAFAPLMGVVAKDLSVDIGQASFGFMGILMFTTAIAVLFWGILVDKFGIFKIMISGMVILLIAHLLYPVMGHDYNSVVFLRILTAIGGAPGLIMIEPIVSRWIPVAQRGLALGLNCLAALGGVAGLTFGPMFAGMAGNWQTGLSWMAGIIFIGILYIVFVAFMARNHQPPVMTSAAMKASTNENFMKTLGKSPAFWLGLAVMALSNWANNAFNDLSPGFLAVAPPIGAGYGPEQAGQMAAGSMIGMMIGIFCGGIIIDKVFKGRSGILVMIGFVCNLIFYNGILFDTIHGNQAILVGWLMLAGVTNPFTAVGNQYFAIRSFSPNMIGKVAASWTCVSNFVGSFGVMIGSYALHHTGNYHASFAIVATICILGFIAAMVSRERRTAIEMSNIQQRA